MTADRVVVPIAVALAMLAGTAFPIARALLRTGATGLTFHRPRKGARERAVGAGLGVVGGLHAVWGGLYAVFGASRLGVASPEAALFSAGACVYACGLVMVVAAQRTMGASWRIGIDPRATALVTTGVYGQVRNPIYTGVVLLGVGMTAMTPSIACAAGAVAYAVLARFQARFEERHLEATHGAAYREYVARVGRFFPRPARVLSRYERRTLLAVCEAILPGGAAMPPATPATEARVVALLDASASATSYAVRATLRVIDLASWLSRGRAFHELPRSEAERCVDGWLTRASGPARHAVRALVALIKSAHLELAPVSRALGTRVYAPVAPERARWMEQMRSGARITEDEDLEVDVVIVGTGAGGAPLAYELASRGHAVLLLEEGRYFGREEFTGQPAEASRKMFRDGGLTFALGNVVTPVWAGMTVGGSTTMNSGTCYRTPERVMRAWRDELGLEAFSAEAMAPYFERVERVLGIAPTGDGELGGGARALERGAKRLGLHTERIRRNAPGCDGQGRCMFGCPRGAKRSMNVSYIPMALERGALLYAETRVDEIVTSAGVAKGVVARTRGGARVTVRAKVTVLAGGALMTPLLLLGSRIASSSGMVGRNLSLHPASPVLGLFDERIRMQHGVPQGFAIDHFAREGIMIEEASTPPEVVGLTLPLVGERFARVMDDYERLSAFGYMIRDSSRGRVRRGASGGLRMSYSLNEADRALMQRALEAVVETFLESGARTVFPAVRGVSEIRTRRDLGALRETRIPAGDFALSAVHPLGTARMGSDPKTSVVGEDHRVHDVHDLYVVDGSAVPTSLGVNPQLTIMAMAVRAAEGIHARL